LRFNAPDDIQSFARTAKYVKDVPDICEGKLLSQRDVSGDMEYVRHIQTDSLLKSVLPLTRWQRDRFL
jgi:hypothetical protein